jgi:undecaprenyl-diphosphatase
LNITQIDEAFDRRLESARHNPVVQGFFSLLSRAGEFSMIWHAVIWIRAIGSTDRAKDAVIFSLLLGAESLIVNQGLKRVFRRQRPTTNGDTRFNVRTPVTSSFPSGHSSSAFFAAVTLASLVPPSWAVLFFVLAVLVALSRVMVRLHHLSDIIGGACVGAALGLLALPVIG